jgi:hypothetical protein
VDDGDVLVLRFSGRRAVLLGLCASWFAAACGFPGVTFQPDDGSVEDAGVDQAARMDVTNGDGSVELDTGGRTDGAAQVDSTIEDAVASADTGADGANVGADGGADVGVETGVDLGADALVDTGVDGGADVAVDAGLDVAADVAMGTDAIADASVDAGETADAGSDVSNPVDAADAGVPEDAAQDAADAGSPTDSGGTTDGPNCDCGASQMYPTANCRGLVGLGCTGDGFMPGVACGTSAEYYVCTGTLLVGCNSQPSGLRVQQCQ